MPYSTLTIIMNRHIPVMLSEVLYYLKVKNDGLYIDATVGEGGYSEAIAKKLGKAGKILAIDATAKSIEIARDSFVVEIERNHLRAILYKWVGRFFVSRLVRIG